jgi:uncharacterized protein YabE (DUF348 family)
MNRTTLIFLAAALAIAGIFLVSQGINKTITLDINGHPEQVVTKAWTVSTLLAEQGISLTGEDTLNFTPATWLTGGEQITIERANWVVVSADGGTTHMFTRQRSPQTIFAEAGIELSDRDQILLDGLTTSIGELLTPGENHSLQVERAQSIEVIGSIQDEVIFSTAATIGDALWENEIDLSIADRISPALSASLHKPVYVELKPAQNVTIEFISGSLRSQTAAETVGEALTEAGIALQGLDYSHPGANSPIPKDGKIQVIRVQEDLLLESEPIPYDSLTQPVADLEIDNRSLVQSGVLGLNTKRIRVRYEDEVEVSRQVEDEYISQEPQSEIIGFGTQITPKTINTPDGQIKYWRALSMYAVSYNVTSNGGYGTATGVPLDKGVAAIDPLYIPYGTRMYVPGYGEALAADTGGGIKGRMIDLGYLDENYVSWHEWVTVYFLWPPPENVVWVIP